MPSEPTRRLIHRLIFGYPLFICFTALAACASVSPSSSASSPVWIDSSKPESKVRIPNDIGYWKKSGFVDMVLPIHLPTDKKHTDLIRVWLKVPEHRKISVRWLGSQGRYTLIYPPGTVVDRVESTLDRVDDVRGARIDSDGGTFFHVYEAAPGKSPRWLMGYEWRRGGEEMDREAADDLIKLYYPERLHWYSLHRTHWDIREVDHFRRVNQCAACHLSDAPPPATTVWPYRFETDTRGFFQPIAVLGDATPIRDHREWDLNADDPFVTVWCGSAKTQAVVNGDSRGYKCPGDATPIGVLDLTSALKAGDRHAAELCESRKYLFEHMDKDAQTAFGAAFQGCSIF